MAPVQIYDHPARVHQPKGQRLEVTASAEDVILLVLGEIQYLSAKAQGLGVDLLTDRVLASRAESAPEEVSCGEVIYNGMWPSSWRYSVEPTAPIGKVLSPLPSIRISEMLSGLCTSATRLRIGKKCRA